ncbi:MAG TPA: DNA replication/repair protein RecF [Streptosporangiaceae bacterium]|nr:DNA replication/repair protein RecF [Streptosporangiaceae bacterium]
MHLTRLALTDFRSYAAADVTLATGVSTFTGANGQGKTNLVEAAAYLATFASHRVATDAPLIRHGTQRAILRAVVSSADRDSLLEIEINQGKANRVRLNRAPVPRPRDALGTLRCVLFAPEDLVMVKGDPDGRRRYLDDLLVAIRPRFAGVRADYDRVLRQRTALLKSARAARFAGPRGAAPGAPRALEVWDEHLVEKGAELTAGRLELTAALRPLLAKAYAAVSGEDAAAAMTYRQARQPAADEPSADRGALADGLRQALADARGAELERGVCLVGPHRDELELRVGELPARGYASHGESWSLALALRLAAYDLLRTGGDDPVLLLDDVFAELDAGRRERLAGLISGAEQVVITAAVADDVPERLAGARFEVSGGAVWRA